MSWDDNLINLKYVLADLYFLKEDSIHVVESAGLPRAQIGFQNKAINNWSEILDQADKRGKVPAIIDAALRDYPDNQFLLSAKKGMLTPVQNIIEESHVWKSTETIGSLEALMGKQSTLLPVSWLEVGLERARSVAKVKRADNKYGSGFLTHSNIFVTNHHVIGAKDIARTAIIQFNYQQSADGLDYELVNFELDPDSGFETSAEYDWTFVRVKGNANTRWGAIDLRPVEIIINQRASIIQHPGGEAKQIGLYHNIVVEVNDTHVQYFTDTLPGSSGSPVFDSEWRLIALHQRGGFVVEAETKKRIHPNQGINVNCLLKDLDGII